MKIQRLLCLTCGAVFAVQRNDSADATWYKSVAKYLGQGNARVETVNHPYGSPFGEKDISKCCGKKKHHTMRNLIAALMLVIVTSGANAQSKHKQKQKFKLSIEYIPKIIIDTMYSHQPSYYILVDTVTHELKHYRSDSLYVEQSEISYWKTDNGKDYYRNIFDRTYAQKDYRYFVNGKQIYPIQVVDLTTGNTIGSWRYVITLNGKPKN